jgi:hypothetical protein
MAFDSSMLESSGKVRRLWMSKSTMYLEQLSLLLLCRVFVIVIIVYHVVKLFAMARV